MADKKGTNETKARRSWGKIFFRIGILLTLIAVVGYFVLTSSAFLQGVVLPRVGRTLNSKLEASDVDFSPLTRLALQDVKITPDNAAELLTAKLVRVRYSLLDILRDNIHVEEITMDSPVINLVLNADGTSNLDPLLTALAGGKSHGDTDVQTPHDPSGAKKVAIKSITLKNATLRQTRNFSPGERTIAEINSLNLTATDIRNGAGGKLDFSSSLFLDKAVTSTKLSSIQAMLNGSFTFDLQNDLRPVNVKGAALLSVTRASGEFSDLNSLLGRLEAEITPSEIKQLLVHFGRGEQSLGDVRVNGPFDSTKSEGRLRVEISSIDRRVLNLFGAAGGIDFGSTAINAGCDVELSKGGTAVSSAGRIEVSRFQIKRQGRSTPALDLRCDYGAAVDRAAGKVQINNVNLNVTQKARALLQAELNSPMTIALNSGTDAGASDATLDFALTDLNLADWKALIGDTISDGAVSARLKLLSTQGGKQLRLQIDSSAENLSVASNGNSLRVGRIGFTGSITNEPAGQSVIGSITLIDVILPDAEAAPLDATLLLDASLAKSVVQLRQCSLKLTPTHRATNELALTGLVDFSDTSAITGKIKFAAATLDVTRYYDSFDSKSRQKESGSKSTATKPATPGENKEPAALKLPFKNFIIEANIGRLCLREVDAADFQTTLTLDVSRALLKPFQLTLNNAPVSATADIDLGTPGCKYDLSFGANGVPIAPLANSFSETYRGKAEGTLIATAQIKGAGITGASLKKTLTGSADLNFTNANIQISGRILKPVVTGIATLLNAPQLLQSPLDFATVQLRAGDGKIDMPVFVAQSAALHIESPGSIPIADVLMDSPLNQPVEVSLARELANKLSFANVPTNVAYMKLPSFVHLKGTLGNPDPKTDKAKIAGLTLVGVGAGLLNIGGEGAKKAGGLVNAVGELLTGRPAPEPGTNSPDSSGTNAQSNTSTNQSKPVNLLDLFKKPTK